MTKPPQQLAEELTRKCAVETAPLPTVTQIEKQILQSIPLVELLECAEQLKRVQRDYRRRYAVLVNELETLSTPYDDTLNNLTTKLKQLGVIE